MVLANSEFTRSLKDLAESAVFSQVFKITEEQRLNQTAVEYAVRLMVHIFRDFGNDADVQEFLDKAAVDILTEDAPANVLGTLGWVVNSLHRIGGAEALIPPADAAEGIARRFSLRALEAIAVGLGRNRAAISELPNPDDFVRDRIAGFWHQPQVLEMSASGLRGTTRLQRTVPFGAAWFDPNANA